MRILRNQQRLSAFLFSIALGLSAQAGTITDNFNTSRNYVTEGTAGTIWDGVYLGAGEFKNVGIAGVAGRTLKCDVNTTTNGVLTVQTTETAWENTDDDGFFLYKVVSGNFQAAVHIVTPYDATGYNSAGLMARAFTGAGEPLNGSENWVGFTRFDEYGFANYGRNTVNNAYHSGQSWRCRGDRCLLDHAGESWRYIQLLSKDCRIRCLDAGIELCVRSSGFDWIARAGGHHAGDFQLRLATGTV